MALQTPRFRRPPGRWIMDENKGPYEAGTSAGTNHLSSRAISSCLNEEYNQGTTNYHQLIDS